MAGRKGDRGSGRTKAPHAQEETLQIRVKKKNPLIERRASDPKEDDTRAEISLPTPAPAASIYERLEQTDRTEEIELSPEVLNALDDAALPRSAPPRAQPKAPAGPKFTKNLDDDETVIATEAPKTAKEWEKSQERDTKALDPARKRRAFQVMDPAEAPKRREMVAAQDIVPRERLGMMGTKGAGAAVRQQFIDRTDRALPNVRAPVLKLVRGELLQDELSSLDRALAGDLDVLGIDAAVSPKRSLEHLVNERAYNELTPKDRAAVLRAIAPDPADVSTIKAAIAFLKSGVLRRARIDERQRLLSIFVDLGAEARARMAQIAARKLRGKSALEDRDIEDVSLGEHIRQLLDARSFPRALEDAGAKKSKVLNLAVGAIANPERMSFEEGSDGILGMVEFALAETSPAELLRLWQNLVSPDLAVELAGKGRLDLARVLEQRNGAPFTGRETPLRAVLGLLPELARPPGRTRRPTLMMPGGHGIDADVVARALGHVYGVGFTVAAGASNALRHLERAAADPQRVPPVFVTLLYDRGERLFVFDHLDDDHLYLRAPHGRSTKQAGASRVDPRREVVDPDRAIDRVHRSTLEEGLGVALVPRT